MEERFSVSICFNLRSLTLYRVDGFFLQVIFKTIPKVNQIKDIRIENPYSLQSAMEVSYNGFLLQEYHLKLKSIVICSFYLTGNLYLVSNVPTIFFNLRRIALEGFYWRADILEFLKNNTPNLQSLYIRTYASTLYEPSLTKYVLKIFLGQMFPSLQRLYIQWDTLQQCPLIDGFHSQNIIQNSWPLMQKLTLDLKCAKINEHFLNTFYQNKYWMSKKLIPTVWGPQYNSNPILRILF
ncbi:unnamed protein product [Rotaria sp. Silwood2]|nr:unnamed protein product [Rotaria sp. Silwood2]CAF2849665.1 unnamed protein product [Rotaria sp. Silwood2]CAF3089317.1 unnamed protein product [Rotaria sp. Silwood2]CAF4282539.1 unnamed protein product [Rotaria sp. Silwood2]CAF4365851.1 unnamed protein product [Rotaria sp. Silwood2]